jgi:DNA ligase-1
MIVYDIIQKLKSISGTNDKIEFLKSQKDNKLFKRILRLTYDNNLVYRIKKYKKPTQHIGDLGLDEALDILEFEFTKMRGGNNEARERVTNTLEHLSEKNAEIFELILKRDLKCGINVKTINKAFGYEFIKTPRYMGACSFSTKDMNKLFENAEKQGAEVWSEIKYDGMYINLFVENGRCLAQSRSGKRVFMENVFQEYITKYMDNKVFMGELLVEGVDRYTSNGMINSYTTMREKEEMGELKEKDIKQFKNRYNIDYHLVPNKIYMMSWDSVSIESYENNLDETPLYKRREVLEDILEGNEKIKPVAHKIVKNPQEAMSEFKRAKENGEEGTILKLSTVVWKDGKPKHQLKCKLEFDVEMEVVDFLYGNPQTKYENFINRLVCKSSDGIVNIRTSALTEADMETITEMGKDIIGKIVAVQCSGLSENNKGEKSLLHPRFMCIREDKTEADDYEKMQEIEEMCTTLTKI